MLTNRTATKLYGAAKGKKAVKFDPEKVKRADMRDFDDPRGLFVRSEDYDKLLEMYRFVSKYNSPNTCI